MSNGKYFDEINEDVLMSLADDMASAATTFNSHGYGIFINARESFRNALQELFQSLLEPKSTD